MIFHMNTTYPEKYPPKQGPTQYCLNLLQPKLDFNRRKSSTGCLNKKITFNIACLFF